MTAMTEPRCRLILVTPPMIDLAAFPGLLDEALAGGDVAALLLAANGLDDTALEAAAAMIAPRAHARDTAVLVRADAATARRCNADGFHVDLADQAAMEAVGRNGNGLMVGVGGLKTRHAAMTAGEAPVDYLLFGDPDRAQGEAIHPKSLALARWWAELFEIPCAVTGGTALSCAAEAAEATIEFIALREAVWDHPGGPADAVRRANGLIAEACDAAA